MATNPPCKSATLLVVLASEGVDWDGTKAGDTTFLEYPRKGIYRLRSETFAPVLTVKPPRENRTV